MFTRMRALLLLSVILCVAPPRALAQAHASLGIGVSTVRSAGGSSSAPSLSPTLSFNSTGVYSELNGVLASLSNGDWSGSGRGTLWLATSAFAGGFHLAADGTLAGTNRTGGPWTAAAHAAGELFWARSRWGFGLGAGPSGGWIESQPSVTALHTRARIWWRLGGIDWAVSAEPTRFLGAWFTDASLGASLNRGPLVASVWGLARLSATYGSRTAVSGSIQFYTMPFLALELGGGSYLPDPYQGLPQARYLSAGVRLHAAKRRPPAVSAPRLMPLVPIWQGDSVLLQFMMPGATSVAIAGDWNDWQPSPLRSAGLEGWKGLVSLKPGTYHFALLVDGKEWVVPGGVASVGDGMGGMTALLVVVKP